MITILFLFTALLWPVTSWGQTWYYPGGEPDTSFGDGSSNSGWSPQTFNYGSAITLPAGTVTQLGAYIDTTGGFGAVNFKLGLYNSSGTLVVQSSPTSIPDGSTKTWRTLDVTDTSISAGTYYVLGSSETDKIRYGWDSAGDGVYASQTYASSMASSVTISGPETGQRYGVRAEVQTGGGSAGNKFMLMGVGP